MSMSTLFSTPAERHVFVVGFFEVLCPWKPRVPMPERYPFPIKNEYHYYLAGRGTGFIALLCVLIVVALILKEVLL